MRLHYVLVFFTALSVLLSACNSLPRDDEVDIAPYNVIYGLSFPIQSQKKDNMLYVLDKKSYMYCIDLDNYSSLFNNDLKEAGKSGTLSSNSPKSSRTVTDSEKCELKLPPNNTARPKGIKLAELAYSLTPISFSLSPSGSSLYIVVCVSSDNSDIDGMYYILNFDTAAKSVLNAIPLDTLDSYWESDDATTDASTGAEKSTGNIARQIYANDETLFVSGNKRLFIIPIKDDYSYVSKTENSISAETTEIMSPYLVQEHNGNIYLSSRENNFGVHVYGYDLTKKSISYQGKESIVNDVIGNHYPVSMNIFDDKLYCSSYGKIGIFTIDEKNKTPTLCKKMEISVSSLSFVSDVKTIDDYYAAGFNYKTEEDMTVSTGYNHLFIRSGVALWKSDGERVTGENEYWIDGIIKNIELWKNGDSYFSVSLCQDKDYLIINQLQ